jgi:hypothetical protein
MDGDEQAQGRTARMADVGTVGGGRSIGCPEGATDQPATGSGKKMGMQELRAAAAFGRGKMRTVAAGGAIHVFSANPIHHPPRSRPNWKYCKMAMTTAAATVT